MPTKNLKRPDHAPGDEILRLRFAPLRMTGTDVVLGRTIVPPGRRPLRCGADVLRSADHRSAKKSAGQCPALRIPRGHGKSLT